MLLHVLLFVTGAIAYVTDCRGGRPPSIAPNLLERCNVTASCDYCDRNHMSFDFLCCEDTTAWIASHSIMPMLFYVYFQNPEWTMLLALGFEPLEQIFFNLTAIETNRIDFETLYGSLVGDAFIQGGIGLWIGVLITYCFDFPLLVSTSYRASYYKKKARRRRYIAIWLLHAISVLFCNITPTTQGILPGLFINMGVHVLVFWVLFPWVKQFYGTEFDDDLCWRLHPSEPTVYPKSKRTGFFYSVGLIIVIIQFSNAGFHYLQNDWYQVWLTEAILITGLTIAAIVIAKGRKDYFSVVGFLSGYSFGIATAFVVCGLAFETPTFLYVALGFLIVSITGFVFSQIYLSRPPPYNVNYSRRFELVKPLLLSEYYRQIKDL
jgi:hypothetical protein